MNCIIIDDDSLSCQIIGEHVKKTTSLTLIGSYSNSVEARNILTKRRDIDLIFLDIEMPEMNGFELLNSLENPPCIIVITGDSAHAARAFDFNVIDFLVKPITFVRFCKAIDKTMRHLSKQEYNYSAQAEKEIFIKKGTSLVKLKIKDIIYVEALENYVTLNTNDDRFVIHFTMKGIEEYLPQGLFMRVHRSFIINKANIQSINEGLLDLIVGGLIKTIPIGKSFKDSFLSDISVMAR